MEFIYTFFCNKLIKYEATLIYTDRYSYLLRKILIITVHKILEKYKKGEGYLGNLNNILLNNVMMSGSCLLANSIYYK